MSTFFERMTAAARATKPMCAAVVQYQRAHQVMRFQRCQNRSLSEIEGVPLCGTHVNAIAKGPLDVVVTMHLPEGSKA